MAIPNRSFRQLAIAFAIALFVPGDSLVAAAADAGRLLPAGRDSQNDYSVDPDSLRRDGSTVSFRLTGTGVFSPGATYAAQVMVDCAHHTRRELGSEIHNQWGVKRNGPYSAMRDVFPGTRQDSELQLVCRLAGVPVAPAPSEAAASPAPPSVPVPTVTAAAAPAPAPAPNAAPTPTQTLALALAQSTTPTFYSLPTGTARLPQHNAGSSPASGPQATRAPEPVPVAKPAGKPYAVAPAADTVRLDDDAKGSRAILIDSVRHKDRYTSYVVQQMASGSTWATQEHYVVDCTSRLRAFQPEDSASGARLAASRASPRSPEGRELATACAMPQGPRTRWFAGFVMTRDGVVAAPHERTARCTSITTGLGAQRQPLQLIGHEEDVTLLRLPGPGTWTVMPAYDEPNYESRTAVTMMGVRGTAPRVSAAVLTAPGSNPQDPGWPQVLTLKPLAMNEGIVWTAHGAIGLALSPAGSDSRHAFVRMLPAEAIRARLARHGLGWQGPQDPAALDAETAMRLALAATVPLFCESGN